MKAIVVVAAILAFAGLSSSASALRSHDDEVRIAIYRGPAACEDCAEALMRAIRRVDPQYRVDFVGPNERRDVSAGTLSRYAVYIQPGGGQDIDGALHALGDGRRSAIRSFVANGGGYIGICMGAYLADRTNLALIDATLDSEVGRPGTQAHSEDDTVVGVRWGDRHRTLYYQDGPYLPQAADKPGFRPLAAYRNGDIAAARYSSGKGVVVLSGPHPEADASWYRDAGLPRSAVPQDRPVELLLREIPTVRAARRNPLAWPIDQLRRIAAT
ncbi:BPL-N domain-containing protein [Sphingomonas beigongshangi]|jgi:glutamine amidotransferase-like uncharacterized protein|uniref:BPL-N domain-containing protein n=1 Tax=Sphingomonas beigongshangi TaxID=2782540 RepID=UPI001AEE23FA|nr:BPL-N domain-containing protein [Sphingomonas beigongshangi]